MDVIRLPRKSAKDMRMAPVPQTDTRGHVKSTKALERSSAKELAKITPKLREKGCSLKDGSRRDMAQATV